VLNYPENRSMNRVFVLNKIILPNRSYSAKETVKMVFKLFHECVSIGYKPLLSDQ
jgi:hypothetical protein